jgi:hypothetical protein
MTYANIKFPLRLATGHGVWSQVMERRPLIQERLLAERRFHLDRLFALLYPPMPTTDDRTDRFTIKGYMLKELMRYIIRFSNSFIKAHRPLATLRFCNKL